jgi:hypothetical protein
MFRGSGNSHYRLIFACDGAFSPETQPIFVRSVVSVVAFSKAPIALPFITCTYHTHVQRPQVLHGLLRFCSVPTSVVCTVDGLIGMELYAIHLTAAAAIGALHVMFGVACSDVLTVMQMPLPQRRQAFRAPGKRFP